MAKRQYIRLRIDNIEYMAAQALARDDDMGARALFGLIDMYSDWAKIEKMAEDMRRYYK